jgi:hypothetical protein
MGALKTLGVAILVSSALSIVGFICRDVLLPGPWGEGAEMFFSVLATAAFSHGLAPLFWQGHLSAAAVSRSLRFWLALATGMTVIRYVQVDGGGFNATDIAMTVVVSLVLLPVVVSWFRFIRREATAQRAPIS